MDNNNGPAANVAAVTKLALGIDGSTTTSTDAADSTAAAAGGSGR